MSDKLNDILTLATTSSHLSSTSPKRKTIFTQSKQQSDPFYQSTSARLNYDYIRSTSPSKTKNPIQFMFTSSSSSARSPGKSSTIKSKINSMNRLFTTESASQHDKDQLSKYSSLSPSSDQRSSKLSYRNRPMLTLDRNELDFTPLNVIGMHSPTHKVLVTARTTYGRKKKEDTRKFKLKTFQYKSNNSDNKGMKGMFLERKIMPNKDVEEHKKYMKEMSMWMNKKRNEWKQMK